MQSRLLLVFALTLSILGCAATPMDYFPSSSMSASGTINVGDFRYIPSARGDIESNQVSAPQSLGSVTIDRDVADYFRDAVTAELKFIGVGVNSGNVTLRGEIIQLEWAAFSNTCTLVTIYEAVDSRGEILFTVKLTTTVPFQVTQSFSQFIGRLIKGNVEQLVSEPAFLQAIN